MDQKSETRLPRGVSRRKALKLGLTGLACAACGGGAVCYVADRLRGLGSAGVFKGDAPAATPLGTMAEPAGREGRHWLKLGRNIQCKLCPNECLLEPEDRGHCRNRVYKDGRLYTLAYADPCRLHVDPIEKKPLLHFLPGTAAFSLATAGCGLRCLNCQNWDISQTKPEETKSVWKKPIRLTPADLPLLGAADAPRHAAARRRCRPGRALRLPFDRLHLLGADRLVRIHVRHGEGGPGQADQELLDHLRLYPGRAAP